MPEVDDVYDRTVVPIVAPDGNIGLTWLRELRNYDDNSLIHNILLRHAESQWYHRQTPTQITDFDTWGWEWEVVGSPWNRRRLFHSVITICSISWNETTWQSGIDPLHHIVIDVRDADGSELLPPGR